MGRSRLSRNFTNSQSTLRNVQEESRSQGPSGLNQAPEVVKEEEFQWNVTGNSYALEENANFNFAKFTASRGKHF